MAWWGDLVLAGVVGWGALLLVGRRAEASLAAGYFANSREGTESPALEMVDSEQSRGPRFVPLRRTALTGHVVGGIAHLVYTHVFRVDGVPKKGSVEALYRFPLAGDAAVTGVGVRFGDVTLRAELQPRDQAQGAYDEARREGRGATLLTRESPDVFTLAVAGISPGEDVWVETTCVQSLRRDREGWILRVPLTRGPRYRNPRDPAGIHAAGQPLGLFRDPGHRFSCTLSLEGDGVASSPTHPLAVGREGSAAVVALAAGEVLPDRDFVLRWAPSRREDRGSLTFWGEAESGEAFGETCFSAQALAPGGVAAGLPREIVLLVDHSGSMEGPKWEAADWAVRRFLRGLTPRDRFAVGVFHHSAAWFSPTPLPATAEHVEAGVRFVLEHRDSGGTELAGALAQALEMPRLPLEGSRHLIVITDAQVSEGAPLLRLASDEFSRWDRRRISVLCIDAAPNDFLACRLAEAGGGDATFLTSSPEEEDMATALEDLLGRWDAPVLRNCRLRISRPGGVAFGRRTLAAMGETVVDLGDLLPGGIVTVQGVVPGNGEGLMARFEAEDGAGSLRELAEAPLEALVPPEGEALRAVVGSRRLSALEYLLDAGHSEERIPGELRRLGYGGEGFPEGGLRELLVREARRYGVACAAMAFVAVRREKGLPVGTVALVPNALPQGWDDGFCTGAVPPGMRCSSMPCPSVPMGTTLLEGTSFLDASVLLGADIPDSSRETSRELFRGDLGTAEGETVLFDLAAAEGHPLLAGSEALLSGVTLTAAGTVAGGAELRLYLGDRTLPRVVFPLGEILGDAPGASVDRPIHLRWRRGEDLVLTLWRPQGSRGGSATVAVVLRGTAVGA